MRLHRKAHTWFKEFVQLFHGAVVMSIYTEAPKHYLGHIVEGKVPVILVPGILGRWGYMKKLGDKISLGGHPVHIIPELGLNIYSVPTSAKMLRALIVHGIPALGHIPPRMAKGAEIIRTYIEERDLKGVVIVAHSKGGLIGKYLLAHHNADHRTFGMVAIATPFSGSALAKLIPHDSFKELKVDSEIIRDLEAHKKANSQIISIFPEYDTHIWADSGSYLEGAAENIEVPVGGHNTLLANKEIQKAVTKAVERLAASRHAA